MAADGSKKKPELTEADKALLEAEPDWERMGQAAKRLLSGKPDAPSMMRSSKLSRQGQASSRKASAAYDEG